MILSLRIREYTGSAMVQLCDVWVIENPGKVEAGLLHGRMGRERAEALAVALGLAVEVESRPVLDENHPLFAEKP